MAVIRGTSGNDILAGTSASDELYGLGGDDVLDGGEGADIYDGGDGHDLFKIWGAAGADIFIGGDGLDIIRLIDGVSTVSFSAPAGAGVERLDFGGFDLTGTDGDDVFNLGSIVAFVGRRTIWLNDGDDVFLGAAASDDVHGGNGDDRLEGGGGHDILEGGTGNDILDGGSGNDRFILRGLSGTDVFRGGSGTDRIVIAGGTEVSRLMVTDAASVEILSFDGGELNGTASRDLFDLSGIAAYENRQTIRMGSGVDIFYGSLAGDAVDGGSGNDRIDGAGGNDRIEGGIGNDTLLGGDGDDVFLIQGAFGIDAYDGGRGNDVIEVTGGAHTRHLLLGTEASIEVLKFTGADLNGTDEDDVFDLAGISTIVDGRTIWLQSGDDEFTGAQAGDSVAGGDGDDMLDGAGGDDVLEGGRGNDLLIGGSGNDAFLLQGDFGNDTIRGGIGIDAVRIVAAAEATSFILDAAASIEILAFADGDLIGTNGNDRFDLSGVMTVTGPRTFWLNSGNDTFVGSRTGDKIHSGGGNDVLQGGMGADQLYGGTGYDTFVYASTADSTMAAAGRDRIEDFSSREGDHIDLTAIDAQTADTVDQAFKFIGTNGYSGTSGELRIMVVSNGVFVYADTNGDRSSDMSIFVAGVTGLTAADFLL